MRVLGTNGNCDVFFPPQIQQRNLINNEEHIQMEIDRMADLINEELMTEEDQNE